LAFTGATREKCIAALDAANGDVNLAFEFVSTGVPSRQPQAPTGGMGGGMGGGTGASEMMQVFA
jgi:hypothetical protein